MGADDDRQTRNLLHLVRLRERLDWSRSTPVNRAKRCLLGHSEHEGKTTMATRLTWVGGGSNKASNPKDWVDPNGLPAVPRPGDILSVAPGVFTINISGNDLVGTTLGAGHGVNLTLNMSHNAVANLAFGPDPSVTINIAANSTWTGSLSDSRSGPITVTGGKNSAFSNQQSVPGGAVVVGVPVIGTGAFYLGASGHAESLEFLSTVAQGQHVDVGTTLSPDVPLKIDRPSQFDGSTTLGDHGEIDLMALAAADSYSYQNAMLSIYSGNSIIDTLRLTDQTTYGFVVEPPTTAGTVVIAPNDPVNGLPHLPVHGGT